MFYRCSPGIRRAEGFFGRTPVLEQALTHDAVTALEQAHLGAGYVPTAGGFIGSRRACEDGGIAGANCQPSGAGCSLHNYCLAYDIEYNYNRHVQHSITPADLAAGRYKAVCKYTPVIVAAIEGVKNLQGEQLWTWAGYTIGDTMHWQINVPPERTTVQWETVPGVASLSDMNLEALVNAAFDAGNPAVQGDRNHWLSLAKTDPKSWEWYNLFKAMLTPTSSINTGFVAKGSPIQIQGTIT